VTNRKKPLGESGQTHSGDPAEGGSIGGGENNQQQEGDWQRMAEDRRPQGAPIMWPGGKRGIRKADDPQVSKGIVSGAAKRRGQMQAIPTTGRPKLFLKKKWISHGDRAGETANPRKRPRKNPNPSEAKKALEEFIGCLGRWVNTLKSLSGTWPSSYSTARRTTVGKEEPGVLRNRRR